MASGLSSGNFSGMKREKQPSTESANVCRPRKTRWLRNVSAALAAAGVLACQKPAPPPRPLDAALESGEIVLITRTAPTTFFRYRDRPMGFEYELARGFADYLGVRLSVEVAAGWTEMERLLAETPAAFLAPGLPVSPERADGLVASEPYLAVRTHIVLGPDASGAIEEPADLAGHTVHLAADSMARPDLEALREDGVPVSLAVHEDAPAEELIRRVAEGRLPAAAAPGHVALLNRRYYPETRIGTAVGEPHDLRWLVRAGGDGLRRRMDDFFRTARETGAFQAVFDRYFGAAPPPRGLQVADFRERISEIGAAYLPLIRAAAEACGFDWRVVAAQAYQESLFDPEARSPAGAVGLMQLVPETARDLGVTDPLDPAANIEGGVRHLRRLYDFFDGAATEEDRLRIALAAYNVGQGHLLDARNLARKRGLDPDRWASLETTLPLLREERFYRDSLYGYCRGTEPVTYVRRIMAYADVLRSEAATGATADNS